MPIADEEAPHGDGNRRINTLKIKFLFAATAAALALFLAGCGGSGGGGNETLSPLPIQPVSHANLAVNDSGSTYTTDGGVLITSSSQTTSPVTITVTYANAKVGDIVVGPKYIAFTSSDPMYSSTSLTASTITDQFGTKFYETFLNGALYRGAVTPDIALRNTELVMFLGSDKKSQQIAIELASVMNSIVTF